MLDKNNEQQSKHKIRTKILARLRAQEASQRASKSSIIGKKLFALPIFRQSNVVLFYAAFDGEVDTFDMMKQTQQYGKRIALPRVNPTEHRLRPTYIDGPLELLAKGPFGIQEPVEACLEILDLHEIDLVIVPGVAFDKANHRLGRGGGYYDRFLGTLSQKTATIGLAFDFQIVPALPCQEAHDIPVWKVLTN